MQFSEGHVSIKILKPGSSSKMPTKPGLSFLFVPFREQDRNLDFPLMICRVTRTDSFLEDTENAEAYVVVRVRRIVVVTIGNGAVVGIVVPATAAFHTVRSACRFLPQIALER